ncbi:MAG: PH domain-containing protein [Acidobacteria bacterium]|nr:PH domain-containing protein [Acidobacteriota bacterium]
MSETIIRPSTKLIKLTYWLAILLAAVIFSYSYVETAPRHAVWALIVPAGILLAAASMHFSRLFTKLTVTGDRLRYETGVLSKSTRSMELGKLQDVRVDQTLGQRMLGLGNLSLETAGETGALMIANIDRPHEVADSILEAARQGAKS